MTSSGHPQELVETGPHQELVETGPLQELVEARSSLRAMRGMAGVKIEGRFWNMTPSSYILCENALENNAGITDGSLIFVKKPGVFFGVSYSPEKLAKSIRLTFEMLKFASPNLLLHFCLKADCLCNDITENTSSQMGNFALEICYNCDTHSINVMV